MKEIDLDYLVIAVLLSSGLYVAVTGLVMDLFGLHQFFLHSFTGYATAALAGLHLALNWGRVMAYLKRRFGYRPGHTTATRREMKPLWGRRGFIASIVAAVGGFALGRLASDQRLAEVPAAANDLGTFYHQWSKPGYRLALSSLLDWGGQPARYKTYPDALQITLPDPHGYRGLSLEEALEQRRSQRDYVAEPLSLVELSRLLHAAQGITDRREHRTAPSAGALYPIETYVVAHNVAGLEPGIYHYALREHELELLRQGDFRQAVRQAGVWQDFLGQAGVCFILSAIFQRTRWKYHERTYRYILLEAGHIGQNLYLTATSLGLGACAVGAFLDDDLNDLLGLDGETEAGLYIIAVGKI